MPSEDHAVSSPKRIQRKRTKGWRMPPNTVYVGRPTKWGNPFVVGGHFKRNPGGGFVYLQAADGYQDASYTTILTAAEAVEWFRWFMQSRQFHRQPERDLLATLRGKNLSCWCRTDQPCHADVLLELANAKS